MGTLRAMRSSPTAVAGRLEELRFSLEAFRRRSNQSRYARSDAKESAKTATVAADVSSSDSLRVLCLHGYLQNGDVFKQKTGSLRRVLKGCEFTFLDAPHIAEPFPDSNPDMDDASSAGGVGGRGWWTSGENQQRKEGEAWVRPAQSFACAGFDEGVAHARSSCADIAQDGHGFDGVLAFSQGCAVASMLLREAQQDKGHPLANVKFAILVGGFIPRDTTIASRLRGENGIDSAPLEVHSLLVSGENDLLVPRLRSEALAALYAPLKLGWFDHPGRHGLPNATGTFKQELQAEAEQGQVILEEKNKKRVRYWWEEGYVPGNEKDSDDEKSESGSETKATECEKQPDINALPSVDGEDSDYEVVVPGDAKGGRLVRWGGLHGRLCLADGDLALEDGECESDKSQKALAPLQDYLDELLIPTGEPTEVQAQTGAESLPALENMPPAAAETMAIVLYQTPASRVKPWSFCTITDSMSSKVDQAEVQQVFAIEDAKRNNRLYSEEMQALSQVAIGNYFLRQQQGFEVVQKAKEDEAIRRRQVKEGSKERLPGTKQPLAVSQAWQEHQQVEAASFQKPRKTLLPGSLAGGSSSSSSRMPKETMRKEPGPKPGRQKEVHQDAFDDSDFEPKFKIPEMPLSRRCYRPSHFDEAS